MSDDDTHNIFSLDDAAAADNDEQTQLELFVTEAAQESDDNIALVIPREEASMYIGLSIIPDEYKTDLIQVIAERANYFQNREQNEAIYQRKLLSATLRGQIGITKNSFTTRLPKVYNP